MSKRGLHRKVGAPALPGAGRPPQSVRIKAGAPLRITRIENGGYEHIGGGTATITRSGTDRIIRVLLEDGSTLVITVF